MVIVIILFGAWLWIGYNGLIQSKEGVSASWAQVQTVYQRRADLIPNIVNSVKGSANFEQSTLTAVTNARSAWAAAQQSGSLNEQVSAARGMDSALSRLLVTVEAYPQLQSTQAFRDLITELEGSENRVATARRDYNETVRGFNVKVKSFPTNLLAGMFGFDPAVMFEANSGSENAPNVDFGQPATGTTVSSQGAAVSAAASSVTALSLSSAATVTSSAASVSSAQ